MNEYEVSDYGIFTDAVSTADTLNENLKNCETLMEECKTALDNEMTFMGPICDSCLDAFQEVNKKATTIMNNLLETKKYLIETSASYQSGDEAAANTLLRMDSESISGSGTQESTVSQNAAVVSSVTIPSNIKQSGYTVTCYGEGGWYLGGGANATSIAKGTKQKSVHEAWLEDGARYKDGIAVINIDGQDHYLVATTSTLGTVGDSVNVNLANGETIPCVIADAKSSHDSNYTTYGHSRSNGSVNILEFEVDRNKYNSSGNPTTSTWDLDWDSSSNVTTVDNYGSIL